ncbi:ATP-grasp domain-containing protein [Enterococcus sp. LJL120]
MKQVAGRSIEIRLFFYNQQLLFCDNQNNQVLNEEIKLTIPPLDSRFYTVDIALTAKNHWLVLETGDGQVSNLSDFANKQDFYQRLLKAISFS